MLHLFVHQYLFLKCITEFLHWNYHWVFLWFCRLCSDGLALGVGFMTSCCCLVEFGFSCFNHASIESWFANYSVLDILQQTWQTSVSVSENSPLSILLMLSCAVNCCLPITDRETANRSVNTCRGVSSAEFTWDGREIERSSIKFNCVCTN